MTRTAWLWLAALAGLSSACNALWGLDQLDYRAPATTTAAGGAGGSAGAGGHGGSSGGQGGQGGHGGDPCQLGPFGGAAPLEGISSADDETGPALSADGLTLYFSSNRLNATANFDIWYATRTDPAAPFGPPLPLAEVNTTSIEYDPELSPDGLALYFSSNRQSGSGLDLWRATRPSPYGAFASPALLVLQSSPAADRDPALSPDGQTLFWSSDRPGGQGSDDLWYATRSETGPDFGSPVNLGEINTADQETGSTLSADGLTLYFTHQGLNDPAQRDLWYASRSAVSEPFGSPVSLTELNTVEHDMDPVLSADGLTLYFASNRPGGEGSWDIWVAQRSCLPSSP